jgi:uncharacterized membrane protein (DUF4010 family)
MPDMPDVGTALARLVVALLIGFLVGLDRERAEVRKGRELVAGIRTFPLIGLAGAVPMLVGGPLGMALLVASLLTVGAVLVASYVREAAAGHVGATTEMAAVAVLLLGALAGAGQLEVAGAAGVAVAVLLAAKPPLERFTRALGPDEMAATLELAVISLIVLPLLPDRTFDPWNALNPREIWIVVVLVSSLSFAGFLASRFLGERRGILLTGALGGLVSSTAVTMAMAQRSRDGAPRAAAAAAAIASTIMAARIAVIAGGIQPAIIVPLLPVAAAMVVVGAVTAVLLARGETARGGPARLRNPFSLQQALGFGTAYALVVLAVHVAKERFGAAGLYATAALSGLVDVDAITVAVARGASTDQHFAVAVTAITIAAIANSLVKAGMAIAFGAGAFRVYTASALGALAAAGGLAALVTAR